MTNEILLQASTTMTNDYILNAYVSPDDPRDFIYSSDETVPSTLDYRPEMLPVRDQGKQGSCYAFCASSMKEFQELKNYGCNFYMSPQFIYNSRENLYDATKTNDDGMYSRDVMKILHKKGVCAESDYPYGKEIDIKPPEEVAKKALNHVIKAYARVDTVRELKQALYTNGPCLMTLPVYARTTTMWKGGTERLGGHAMCVVGYTRNGFILRNSWGKNWGDKGHTIFPFEDWGRHSQVWTCVDDELSKKIVKKRFLGCC